MSNVHMISPEFLDEKRIKSIIDEDKELKLSDDAINLIDKCRNYLDRKIEDQDEPIYGVTTGFGALHNRAISKDQLSQLQKNLVMSHACGTGAEVREEIIRLMLLFKAHALSLGKSAVQKQTVQRLLDMFNAGVHPVVYELGSLGASGDLAPLAHLVLPLLNMGEVHCNNEKCNAQNVNGRYKWETIELKSKEGLALLNGTQFMSAHGFYALIKSRNLLKVADISAAISLEAYDGRPEPFIELLHDIRPHRGQRETAAFFREILKGSELINRPKTHIQDPYTFRCIPQVHGASKDAINYAAQTIITEINSITDNPTVFPDEDMVISGGNFHGQPLALVFDHMAIALAELGNISERRVYRLISGSRNLPEFLVSNPGLNSGFMIPQYSAASVVSQNKQLASPASIDSITSSNEQEDHVSMGANAATRLIRIVENIERILAIELFTGIQAMEFRRPLKSSPYLEGIIMDFRKEIPFIEDDQVLYTEIEKATRFVKEYNFPEVSLER